MYLHSCKKCRKSWYNEKPAEIFCIFCSNHLDNRGTIISSPVICKNCDKKYYNQRKLDSLVIYVDRCQDCKERLLKYTRKSKYIDETLPRFIGLPRRKRKK